MATLSNESAKLVAWARGVVNLLMLGVGQQLKILWAVVQLVAVDVVNLFAGAQLAANRFLDNENVLSAPAYFKCVYAPISFRYAVLGLYARLIQPKIVSFWVRLPETPARLAHLLFLGCGLGHTGEILAPAFALNAKQDHSVPDRIAMDSKLCGNRRQRVMRVTFGKPRGIVQVFQCFHGNTSPLYSMGVTS